jgi:hypothetical protein
MDEYWKGLHGKESYDKSRSPLNHMHSQRGWRFASVEWESKAWQLSKSLNRRWQGLLQPSFDPIGLKRSDSIKRYSTNNQRTRQWWL